MIVVRWLGVGLAVIGFAAGFGCRRIITAAVQAKLSALDAEIRATRRLIESYRESRERAVKIAEQAAEHTIAPTTVLGSMAWKGDVVLVRPSVRIALDDIGKGHTGWAWQAGRFDLPATPAETWPEGRLLFWDPGARRLTARQTPFIVGPAAADKGLEAEAAGVELTSGVAFAAGEQSEV